MSEFICVTCRDRGEIGGHSGQTPESYHEITEPCPDCPECMGQMAWRIAERGIILWDALEKIASTEDADGVWDGLVKFEQAKLVAKKALQDAAHHRDKCNGTLAGENT